MFLKLKKNTLIRVKNHDLPLCLVDSLIPFLRKLFPKDQALAWVTLGNQKAKNILRHIFLLVKQTVSWVAQSYFFSVIIDKTTDCTVDKQLAIRALFFSERDLKLHVKELDMVKWNDRSVEGLTTSIKQVIEKEIDSLTKYCWILCVYY